MKKIGQYQVPFDSSGNQMHYAAKTPYYYNYEPSVCVHWVPNFEFEDKLVFSNQVASGRSAKYLLLTSKTTGKKYTMFVKDLLEAIMVTTISKGVIKGTFCFQKRGSNYGVKFLR